ncbi:MULTISPECIES: transcriptional repressor TraM [unclassified Rhizobium]|uniref:transcriptional repressor TraM n=1 Tax=unclassified Rhizobium TaxID=2613769 RepID=UPI001ADB9079|nr:MULTISPECIES: transcriptional repressor TraM [unclassified Rhizobium]MBO9101915.1 transcriptional repressor TraM [Rhizobium sp. L58/93]MBO9172086.1 transcriptional repressor TraM [Rhizobium sp. L245/93]QXZ88304.1 transcriptional repressor TraM [Rhizobium sp. K1/93]QXZ94275.1 transcriptional repressor TraM [Rhizobium sp. K15/93]QYA05636.1 transcriptional repressor TraM [Rhizobium sp. B21/90]
MDLSDATVSNTSELRPVIGLTRGLNKADVETLTVNAIRLHRKLVEKADQLFQALPPDHRTGKAVGGEQHLEYVDAMIAMHMQMNALNMLLGILDYIPNASDN